MICVNTTERGRRARLAANALMIVVAVISSACVGMIPRFFLAELE